MAKTKKTGDELIEDDDAPVATTPKKTRTAKASTKGATKKTTSKKTARGTIKHTAPKAGKTFNATYKGKEHKLTIKASAKAESGVVYVYKGKSYPTPRAAANAARGRETNGWTFWGIVG